MKDPKIINQNLIAALGILQNYLTKDELSSLTDGENEIKLSTISPTVLGKYFTKTTVYNILHGHTRFFDLNKQTHDGLFELHFADRLQSLLNLSHPKKTSFQFPEGMCIGEYSISFMSDEEYKDGLALFMGEICGDCGSLGKPGSSYALFDALSSDSRSFLIRKKGILIGSSIVYLNDHDNNLVIASLNCRPHENTTIIRCLVENLALKLLLLNQDMVHQVVIGIGGRSFSHMNGVKFERSPTGTQTYEYQALGKIRHAPDLSQLAAELQACEAAIGYPILRSVNRIPTAMEQLGISSEVFKDCIHVATIIAQDNLNIRQDEITKQTKFLQDTLGTHTNRTLFQAFYRTLLDRAPSIFLRTLFKKAEENSIKAQTVEQCPQKTKNKTHPYHISIVGFLMWGKPETELPRLQALCADTISDTQSPEVLVTHYHRRSTSSVAHIAQSQGVNPIMLFMKLSFFAPSAAKAQAKFHESNTTSTTTITNTVY